MKRIVLVISAASVLTMIANDGLASLLNLQPGEFVQANGVDIIVPGYSVPSYVDWNNDGRKDLVIGEGGNWQTPGIRVYLNEGTPSKPQFSDYFYVGKSDGATITYVGDECICSAQGLFPRVVDWDGDARKDLLVGQFDGTVMIYLNIGEDANPLFSDGFFLQVGQAGSKANIDVGDLAASTVVDWNNDGRTDLVVGANDSKVHLFINQGTDTSPDFLVETFVLQDGSDLTMHAPGSSPVIIDLDDDGKKDLLIGNSTGQLSFYSNVGTDAAPTFSGQSFLESDGVRIKVDAITGASPRARPYVTDWTGDGYRDVLVGAGDGKVYLYQGIPEPATSFLLDLGPEELVKANGVDIEVPGYSVPSFVDWNNDHLKDLVIGQGSGAYPAGKVRVYLNVGTESNPQFSDYFYVQSNGADLTVPAAGCQGCFPRVVYWDADDRKDLLVGLADGTVKIFLNIGTDSNPVFDDGKGVLAWRNMNELDVGFRATPTFLDWDNDGRTDLIVGARDGKIHIYLNCGCGGAIPPSFFTTWYSGVLLQQNGNDLVVPSERSSPVVLDLDGDGNKDLLTGNTDGQLLFYRNVGTDADPNFSGYSLVESDGVPIDLPGSARSRPFVCYWTGDAYPDVLIGAGDGKVHLYQGIPQIGDIDGDGDVDNVDFALFAIHWRSSRGARARQANCGQCGKADFTGDGKVDLHDFRQLTANWLIGR